MSLNNYTKKELLSLPTREWGKETSYSSLLVLSTGRKHDSKWAVIAIIGCDSKQVPIEIACQCADDIEWVFPNKKNYGDFSIGQVRMDCAMKSGAMHFWAQNGFFHVGMALSSTRIELKEVQA